jgi:hypothetical protein
MKFISGFAFLLLTLSSSTALSIIANITVGDFRYFNPDINVYTSLEQFKNANPGLELTEMNVYDNEDGVSRSYKAGARQTGKFHLKSSNTFSTSPLFR